MRRLVLFMMIFSLIGCKDKPKTPQELILGNWAIHDTFPKNSHLYHLFEDHRGFEFLPDSICDYKTGYRDENRSEAERKTNPEERILYFLGTKTKYAVSKDTLSILNLTEKKWDKFKIKKLNKDTLIISRENNWATFLKKNYKTNAIPDFDAVIVSSSPCYGSCPINDIMIDKNGNVTYHGVYYVPHKGNYTSKISKAEFKQIALRFKQANYINLDSHYSTIVTDSQTTSVLFIKDGKIIKSISDYARSAPDEFLWAYCPLIFMGQQIPMKPIAIPSYLKSELIWGSFSGKDSYVSLTESEMFYLLNILQKSKTVRTVFPEKYVLRYDNDLLKEITTDGRYYKFYFKDDSTKIIDIGYNFITENKLANSFEKPNR
jgi:hypothetical protein